MEDELPLIKKKADPDRKRRHLNQLKLGKISRTEYKRKSMGSSAAKKQLEIVYIRDRFICHLCKKFVKRQDASRDHVKSLWRGGTNDLSNVKLAHIVCNDLKNREELPDLIAHQLKTKGKRFN